MKGITLQLLLASCYKSQHIDFRYTLILDFSNVAISSE